MNFFIVTSLSIFMEKKNLVFLATQAKKQEIITG
jgi:hypothetical protein